MKTVIYRGEPAAIGRFGNVDPGAHLQLTEAEFAGVKDDPSFELISRRKPLRDLSPVGTPLFDLRLIEWEHPHLTSMLSRKGQTTLKLIAGAMNQLGADVIITEHDGTELIVDAIVSEAKALKWNELDKETRHALPVLDGEDEGGGDTGNDYSGLSAKELRALCEDRGVSASGGKAEMIARLQALDEAEAEDKQSEEEESDTQDESTEGTDPAE